MDVAAETASGGDGHQRKQVPRLNDRKEFTLTEFVAPAGRDVPLAGGACA